MKIYKLIGCFFICINSFGQVDEINDFAVTVNRVEHMAVFPGCENYEGNKRKLVTCFSNEMSKIIIRYLDLSYPDTAVPSKQIAVQLEYNVNTNGEISDIEAKRGDEILKPQAIEALERASAYLVRKGKYIKPARLSDGSLAVLSFNQTVVLRNPDYSDGDWIYYYYKKNYNIDNIYQKLKSQGITQFNKDAIRQHINTYKKSGL